MTKADVKQAVIDAINNSIPSIPDGQDLTQTELDQLVDDTYPVLNAINPNSTRPVIRS